MPTNLVSLYVTTSPCHHNGIRTHDHLVCNGTLNYLAKFNHLTLWPVWWHGWVIVYKLSGCGFEFRWSHLNFIYRACFEQGVHWHSGNSRLWIHSKTRMWHDKNTQSPCPCHPYYIFSTFNRIHTFHGKFLFVAIETYAPRTSRNGLITNDLVDW